MLKARFSTLVGSAALLLAIGNVPALAKTTLTTPRIGNPSRPSSPSSYDSPMSGTAYGWGNATPRTAAPYAANPYPSYTPPPGSSYDVGNAQPTQPQAPINYRTSDNIVQPTWEAQLEGHYERFMDWSTEISGGSSVRETDKKPLPRTAATTLRDRKDAATGYVPMTVRSW